MHAHVDTNAPAGKVYFNLWVDPATKAKFRLAAKTAGVSNSQLLDALVADMPDGIADGLVVAQRYSDHERVVRFLKKHGRTRRNRLLRATHMTAHRLDEVASDLAIGGVIEVVPNEVFGLVEYAAL